MRRARALKAIDDLVYRLGPAVRRVPPQLRARALRQEGIPAVADRIWFFGREERVVPGRAQQIGGHGISRLAQIPHRLPRPFVAELRNARLVGQHAVPFTRRGDMLLGGFRESLAAMGHERHIDLEAWLSDPDGFVSPSADLVDVLRERPVLSLVSRFDSNYFHWLIDLCSLLEGLSHYRAEAGERPVVLVRAGLPGFAAQSLGLLGCTEEDQATWPLRWHAGGSPDEPQRIQADVGRLVVTPFRGHRHGLSGSSLAWLRRAFLGAVAERGGLDVAGQAPAERLYLQRRPGGWRTVANEEALQALLSSRGFTTVRPEDHSLVDQIALFSRASVIVGMHGAALTNVLFAPRAQLIELGGGYGGSDYFSICGALGNPYRRVACRDAGTDIVVDPALLAKVLDASP